jgi:hypothetical protein
MTGKTPILEELGERALMLPTLVATGAAIRRLGYMRFTSTGTGFVSGWAAVRSQLRK